MEKVWNESEREVMMKELEKRETIERRVQMNEHLDMVMKVKNEIIPLEHEDIDEEELLSTINDLKKHKAPGPDKMVAELFKELIKSKTCVEAMTRCFNNILTEGAIPEEWKESKTKMIPKNRKPTIKDFRPIALTNISYKIFMTIVKNRIENHLKRNTLEKENQTGFTKGGRKEDNLFILQHLVEKTYMKREKLIVTAIDYSKAYDSIDREKMIEALKDYKIHPNIIDRIAKIYNGDFTNIKIGEEEIKLEITSGIKQGCPLSTTLFKIITYIILTELEEKGKGLVLDDLLLLALFFADDSLLLADSVENARHNLKILINASEKFGLKVNEAKCKILIFDGKSEKTGKKRKRKEDEEEEEEKEEEKEIEGIKIVKSLKYLGVTIENKRNLFKQHKENNIQTANKLANLTYGIIQQSVNKMLIGKTYWKNIVLPSILQSIGVITYTNSEIEDLQKIENGVYRRILGGRQSTPICVLRGEVGSSLARTRMIEGKLVYLRSIQTGNNQLVQEVLERTRNQLPEKGDSKPRNITWNKQLNEFLQEVNMRYGEIKTMKKEEIKKKIREWDTEKWKEELRSKSSVKIYRNFKEHMKDDGCYDNKFSSKLLFKARSNTLNLKIENRHKNGDTSCDLCNEEKEDLVHFLLDCKILENKRNINIMTAFHDTNKENMVGKILHSKEEIEEVKQMIESLWNHRKKLIKEKYSKP